MSSDKRTVIAMEFRGLLRYSAAAAYIGLAEGTLRNQHEELGIQSVKIGRVRCFPVAALDDFIERKILETERAAPEKAAGSRGESGLWSGF